MAAPATRRPGHRVPPPAIPSSDPPMEALPPAVRPNPHATAADLAPVLAALARTVQAAIDAIAGDIGRGDVSRNGTLVRLGAAREDVETLRAFLAAQPRPAHIPPED